MKEKIKLSGVPETMLQTVYARAKESSSRGAIETASSAALVHLMQEAGRLSSDLDDTMIHIVVSSMFTGIFEIIAHDAPMDVALRHISILQDFYTAGWYKILGIL